MQTLLLLTAALAVLPPSGVGQAPDRQRDSLAILAVVEGIIAADNARNLAAVLACYSDSALLLPPNAPSVRGRAAIQPRYEQVFAEFSPAIEGHIDRVTLSDEWAYVRGRNLGRLRARRPGAADRPLHDVYTMLLRKEGAGVWRIAELAWHSTSSR